MITSSIKSVALVYLTVSVVGVLSKTIYLGSKNIYGCDRERFEVNIAERLDRFCGECQRIFSGIEIITGCRSNCFKNEISSHCIVATLLDGSEMKKQLEADVEKLNRPQSN